MRKSKSVRQRTAQVLHPFLVVIGASLLTLAFFLALPLMQAISTPPENDLVVHSVSGFDQAPVPPSPEEKQEEKASEPESQDTPPELTEESEPLTLEQITMALNPTIGEGALAGDFATKLNIIEDEEAGMDPIFSMADLDQAPRVIYQPGPIWTNLLRRKAPATVYIEFTVNTRGTVENPIVEKTTDPVFNKPALAAVKQWKFDPGTRNGNVVRFRMRVPITFPRGR